MWFASHFKGGLWFQDGKYHINIFYPKIYVDWPIFHYYWMLHKKSGLPKAVLHSFCLHLAAFFSFWNLLYSISNTLNVSDHKIYVRLPIFQQQWGRLQYFDLVLLHHAKQAEKTKQNQAVIIQIHFCLIFVKRGRQWLITITLECCWWW